MTSTQDSSKPTDIQLEDWMAQHHADLSPLILGFLRYPDSQRLSVTCRSFETLLGKEAVADGSSSPTAQTLHWLREIEILSILKCPPALLQKMSDSIRLHPYKIMEYSPAEQEDPILKSTSLFDAFGESLWNDLILELAYHRDCLNFKFEELQKHPDWQHDGVHGARALDDCYGLTVESGALVEQEEEEEGSDEDDRPSKKQRRLECSSRWCKDTDGTPKRLFRVRKNLYCGACLDDNNPFLRLMYGVDNVKLGHDKADWASLQEISYQNNRDQPSLKQWGLKKNQYWVRVFFIQPYDLIEYRFIGVGPRGTDNNLLGEAHSWNNTGTENEQIGQPAIAHVLFGDSDAE